MTTPTIERLAKMTHEMFYTDSPVTKWESLPEEYRKKRMADEEAKMKFLADNPPEEMVEVISGLITGVHIELAEKTAKDFLAAAFNAILDDKGE
jgi:hypothetical protein